MFYLYTFLLLVITCIASISFKCCIKVAIKIRILSVIVFSILLLRYATLLILFYSSKITYLYNLKYSFSLQLCVIPILISIIMYIVIRNNKINFNYVYLLAIIFLFVYIGIVLRNEVSLRMFTDYRFGYYMYFANEYILVYYGAINLIALIFNVWMLYESNDKRIIYLCIFSALISVIEVVVSLMGIKVMPQYLLGELLWASTLVYSVIRIKKSKKY